jgi:hypothetical protein
LPSWQLARVEKIASADGIFHLPGSSLVWVFHVHESRGRGGRVAAHLRDRKTHAQNTKNRRCRNGWTA